MQMLWGWLRATPAPSFPGQMVIKRLLCIPPTPGPKWWPHREPHTPTHQAKVPARSSPCPATQGLAPHLCVPQEVWSHKKDEVTSDGTLVPKAGPIMSPRQKKTNKHKVLFKMAKRKQRSHSGPSWDRWTAVLLARRKPLCLKSLRTWAKPSLRRCRARRGASRPTSAKGLCTCSLGQTQTQPLASRGQGHGEGLRAVGGGPAPKGLSSAGEATKGTKQQR